MNSNFNLNSNFDFNFNFKLFIADDPFLFEKLKNFFTFDLTDLLLPDYLENYLHLYLNFIIIDTDLQKEVISFYSKQFLIDP
jgi:hypothetical protein